MPLHNPYKPASPAQVKLLQTMGIPVSSGLRSDQADRLIKSNIDYWSGLPPTMKQESYLRRFHQWKAGMNRREATDTIAKIKGGQDFSIGPPKLTDP